MKAWFVIVLIISFLGACSKKPEVAKEQQQIQVSDSSYKIEKACESHEGFDHNNVNEGQEPYLVCKDHIVMKYSELP